MTLAQRPPHWRLLAAPFLIAFAFAWKAPRALWQTYRVTRLAQEGQPEALRDYLRSLDESSREVWWCQFARGGGYTLRELRELRADLGLPLELPSWSPLAGSKLAQDIAARRA